MCCLMEFFFFFMLFQITTELAAKTPFQEYLKISGWERFHAHQTFYQFWFTFCGNE